MIAVIDYGVGNLFSLTASLKFLGAETIVTNKREDILAADRIILPGVGAFEDAIAKLKATGLVETIIAETKKASHFSASAWECSFSLKKAMNTGNMKAWDS